MKLYCATTNAGKLREFRLAAGLGLEIETLDLRGIAAPEETGLTFEENAAQKALYYAAHAPGPLFAEDSGLEVAALGGAQAFTQRGMRVRTPMTRPTMICCCGIWPGCGIGGRGMFARWCWWRTGK